MSIILPTYLGVDETTTTIVHSEDPFNVELCVEPAVLKKTMHQEVMDFMKNWSTDQMVENYARTRPHVSLEVLHGLLSGATTFVRYCGSDFIYSKDLNDQKEFLMIETNIYTGGQDAMSLIAQSYESQLNSAILNDDWKRKSITAGGLAHIYGKKTRRDYAFPHVMAKLVNEPIHVVPFFSKQADKKIEKLVRFVDGTMEIKLYDEWLKIRACFSTLNYRPWAYIPVTNNLQTYICPHPIAGFVGKNKILSEYAFRDFNEKYAKHGIEIRGPRTMVGISKADIRGIVEREFNGRAVIKTPYDGQGRSVYIIRNEKDLDEFYARDESDYSLWVVQELIGVGESASDSYQQVGYHIDSKMYAYSLRIIACVSPSGFKMTNICCARAPMPFARTKEQNDNLEIVFDDCIQNNNKLRIEHEDDVYITNIGPYPKGELRSFYVDDVGMIGMGINLDDVVNGFMQTVFSVHAIDDMCKKLTRQDGELNLELLKELNPDPQLLTELVTNWK